MDLIEGEVGLPLETNLTLMEILATKTDDVILPKMRLTTFMNG